MRARTYTYFILITVVALAACRDYDQLPETEAASAGVRLSMAVLQQPDGPVTRMGADATQADGRFRGIEGLCVIPFARSGKVEATDERLQPCLDLPTTITSIDAGTHAVLYDFVHIPRRTASVLVYGHAPTGGTSKFSTGALQADNGVMASGQQPGAITFQPEAIYSGSDVPDVAQAIATYLSTIAQTTISGSTRWMNSTNSTAKTQFGKFTNSGNVMAGSTAAVERLLTTLYRNYSNTNVRSAINNSQYATVSGTGSSATVRLNDDYQNYPASLNLPDGAAGLRWNGTAFEGQMETTTTAKMMSARRFCYAPCLWYFANSRIKTSDTDSEREHYADASISQWSVLLGEFANDNATVSSTTQAVAIKDALNYGVAKLCVSVVRAATLRDASNTTVSSPNFPLTAVIVGQQRAQDFLFRPLPTQDYSIYDPTIANDGITLGTTKSAYTNTLVLQSRGPQDEEPGETVYFVLEFLNNTTQDFQGANGVVYAGSKFYLTVALNPAAHANYDATDDSRNRVFCQDRNTYVTCTIQSLKDAWNVVPDLRDPQLEIGVGIVTDWVQATTTNVRMD